VRPIGIASAALSRSTTGVPGRVRVRRGPGALGRGGADDVDVLLNGERNPEQARQVAATGYGFVRLSRSLQRLLAEDDGDSVD
jgi:hypothetical protein